MPDSTMPDSAVAGSTETISKPDRRMPEIPDGCGILPVAVNRIASPLRGEHVDAAPREQVYAPEAQEFEEFGEREPDPRTLPVVNDALEQRYRRVLARSLALAAAALGVAALSALSMKGSPTSANLLLAGPVVVRLIFFSQLVLLGLLSRYVERLAMIPAAVLLFSYAAFCGMEFSVLFSPATLAVALLCGGLMYGATALWGYLRGCDLAHPITPVIMILGGGLTLACLNQALGTPKLAWSLSAVVVVLFAVVEGSHAQQVRDLYQDFDDDNAQGWKASVVGASLLVVNSLNLYVLATTFLGRFLEEETQPQRRSERF